MQNDTLKDGLIGGISLQVEFFSSCKKKKNNHDWNAVFWKEQKKQKNKRLSSSIGNNR